MIARIRVDVRAQWIEMNKDSLPHVMLHQEMLLHVDFLLCKLLVTELTLVPQHQHQLLLLLLWLGVEEVHVEVHQLAGDVLEGAAGAALSLGGMHLDLGREG